MTYRVLGIMSGSSLDGMDIAFIELTVQMGKWSYEIIHAETLPYNATWKERLSGAIKLNARDYLLLHSEYGHFIGNEINHFIEKNNLYFQVSLITSHGHTTFHEPGLKMTAQLGDGAAIASVTGLPVVTDLRALDVAFGGQGAPIVPIGEKLLFSNDQLFLNIGGIANISINLTDQYIAYDICPANSILNRLAQKNNQEFDNGGEIALSGKINEQLLDKLNNLQYYQNPYPKSLSNNFGSEIIYPVIEYFDCSVADSLRTYCEHIALQVKNSLLPFEERLKYKNLFITGGGAFNSFLINTIKDKIKEFNIRITIPDHMTIKYKESLIMGLIGVLRWRQEYNVLSEVTGSSRNSIGGSVWNGQEA